MHKNKYNKGFVIAIDGPSGAGKSTVARLLAEHLGGLRLDTGAMYRSVAYVCIKKRAETANDIVRIARSLKFSIRSDNLNINGQKLDPKIRTEQVGAMASKISQISRVRTILNVQQKKLAQQQIKLGPVVVEGRDIGTVVFPRTPFKYYITANENVRARRRYDELVKQGFRNSSIMDVLRQNRIRDRQDRNRTVAPLRRAHDALRIDTSAMTPYEVIRCIGENLKSRSGGKSNVRK